MGLCNAGFGEITYLPNNTLIVLACVFLELINGFSASLIQTNSYTLVSTIYGEERKKYLGILEASIGIGFVIGPPFGSTLYKLFGFEWTFRIIGALLGLSSIILWKLISSTPPLPTESDEVNHLLVDDNEDTTMGTINENLGMTDINRSFKSESEIVLMNEKPIGYVDALKNRMFVLCSICAFYSYFVYCFQEPVLSLRVEEFIQDDFWIGMFFMIGCISYTITCVVFPILSQKYDNKKLIPIGLFGCGLCCMLVGPCEILPNSFLIMGIGQFLYLPFDVFYLITPLPEMITQLEKKYPGQSDRISDISSGVLNACYGLGQMLGPIYGSNITHFIGFRNCATTVGLQLIAFGVIYLILWKCCACRSRSERSKSMISEPSSFTI